MTMTREALSEPINCVKCKHYYETEDDTDVHGNCRMVEVVRCKDCKNRARYAVCDFLGEDGFCSHGERRSDE